ncbi:hypothetical protein THF1D04_30112 [Vibrio owensii]|uniref:Uncharacterized protein n=1 Tax=Vibrio owensii TaxID=696485 RepID=A0AAU9Q801_9VIBR|nr:hypothetical protein THF1D04_30112 [Vibrio owensii]
MIIILYGMIFVDTTPKLENHTHEYDLFFEEKDDDDGINE